MKTSLLSASPVPSNLPRRARSFHRILGFCTAYTLLALLTSTWTARQLRHAAGMRARLPVSTQVTIAPLPADQSAFGFGGMNAH